MTYIGTARHLNGQKVPVTGASATFTNPIGNYVNRFCLSGTIDICFRQGKTPLTALVTDTPVYAKQPYYFTCNPGESVAVIALDGASTGSAYIQEAV